MLEEKIDELIVALNGNTEILQKLHDLKVGDVPPRTTGEVQASIASLEKGMHADQEEGEAPVKKSKKKSSKKKTAKKTEPAAGATPLDKEKVQTHIRGIASQLTDTSKLFALIQKHGGQQFSDLDASCYEALIADAEQLVVDGA